MRTWWAYLRRGLARQAPEERIAGAAGREGTQAGLRNLRPYIARRWREGALGALFVVLTSFLAFPQPLLNRYLIDRVILGKQLHLLLGVGALMAGTKVLGMLTGMLEQFLFARFEQGLLLDIQQALLARTLRFPKSFFDEQEVGYLMSRLLSDVQGLRWFFSSMLVYAASNVLRFLGGVGLLFYLEWRLALVALVALPGLVAAVRYFSGKSRALSLHGMERQADVSRRVQESLSMASLIKASVTEERTVTGIMDGLRGAFQVALEQVAVGSAANVTIGVLGDAARWLVLIAGAYWAIAGEWSLGSLLAFQAYVGYVYGPAQFLASAQMQLQNALAAMQRVSALFDIVPEEHLGVGLHVERLRGEVAFRDVSFSYDGREPVLEGVSFVVHAGERVAIVGPSGVGKTTLLSLILGFYRPTRGEIWFDGRPASEYELSSLRQRIGYVAQSTLLLSGTIAENLRYGHPEASDEEVIRAATVAGIHAFVAGLPQGYDSPLGERGVNLSEGQKQRLAIARALVQDPDILVLDEPTAALDSALERSILQALPAAARDKTLFVVTHRLSTERSADRILLLNETRLVAVGTHQELLESSAYYASLVADQGTGEPGTLG